MSTALEHLFSILGLGLLIGRLCHWPRHTQNIKEESSGKVSIIVPCRNEATNVEALLHSLGGLEGPVHEILIVDDGSTDATAEKVIASAATYLKPPRLISAPPKPDGWVGKSWACWTGAQQAQGEILLFTDADTRHRPKSLSIATSFLLQNQADLISAPPFHLCGQWWEKLLGLFHLLPLVATKFSSIGPHRFRAEKRSVRLFAIGQYLMIRRNAYFSIGGHQALKTSLAEDIDLAKRVAEGRGTYAIYPKTDLYSVQMYRSFTEFFVGWSRLMRVGLPRVSLTAVLEIALIFHLFFFPSAAIAFALLFVAWIQQKHGGFSIWGIVFFPLSLILFCAVTFKAQADQIMQKGVNWHGRTYPT